MTEPTLYTKFTGWWCGNCRVAADYRECPVCDEDMRPALVTIQPRDIPGEPDPARIEVPKGWAR